jgi:hypothetical protein
MLHTPFCGVHAVAFTPPDLSPWLLFRFFLSAQALGSSVNLPHFYAGSASRLLFAKPENSPSLRQRAWHVFGLHTCWTVLFQPPFVLLCFEGPLAEHAPLRSSYPTLATRAGAGLPPARTARYHRAHKRTKGYTKESGPPPPHGNRCRRGGRPG